MLAGERGSNLLRVLDRGLGVPLVWSLGALRARPAPAPRAPTRVGALACAAIGDTMLLGAVLRDLRDAYPRASLVLFAGRSNAAGARLLAVADQVVELPITRPLQACRALRRFDLDLLIDFSQWHRISAVLAHCARARCKIGFRTSGQYRHYVYDLCVDHSCGQHELENFRDLVRPLGVAPRRLPSLPERAGRASAIERALATRPYVVFHLWPSGYRSHLKEWPVPKWLELGRQIGRAGLPIVLTGAPCDREKNEQVIALATKRECGAGWVNAAGCSLGETAAILRRSRLTVSVNTGVMHLAAAAGAAVIGLHGPTSALRWGPIGPRAIAVSAQGADCGYLNLGFEYPPQCDCMCRIGVDEVLAHCRSLLRIDAGSAAIAPKRVATMDNAAPISPVP